MPDPNARSAAERVRTIVPAALIGFAGGFVFAIPVLAAAGSGEFYLLAGIAPLALAASLSFVAMVSAIYYFGSEEAA